MYTFVFLWSPVLEQASSEKLPFGIIFSTFMVCIMIGSMIFKILRLFEIGFAKILTGTLLLAVLSFVIPSMFSVWFINQTEIVTFWSFNVFEMCCGIYFPCIGSLKSEVIPESTRSTVMNIFRIPLNIIVVVILLKVDSLSNQTRFALCAALSVIGFVAAIVQSRNSTSRTKKTKME